MFFKFTESDGTYHFINLEEIVHIQVSVSRGKLSYRGVNDEKSTVISIRDATLVWNELVLTMIKHKYKTGDR